MSRNQAIAAAYKAGESLTSIGARYGLCISRISYIALREGVRLTGTEQARRVGQTGAANARNPAARARISATIKHLWAGGKWRGGRPMLFADDPVKRGDYLALRNVYGAAYAREAMGL